MKTQIFLNHNIYYYDKENDKLYVYKIVKIKNENEYVIKSVEDGSTSHITYDEIKNKYTLLKPDGIMYFSIVKMRCLDKKIKDVIVTLFRTKDLENGNQIPYCLCRQNIYNLFANQVKNPYLPELQYIGMSISVDTCPEGTDYPTILSCNGIEDSKSIAYYVGDTIDYILSLFKNEKYDNTISLLKHEFSNFKNIIGCTNTLKELLKANDFMYDVLKGYNIDKVPFKVEIIEDELAPGQRQYLEGLYKCEMFKTYVLKYSKEIDLKSIKRNYVTIEDIDNTIYIVAYDKGEYLNREYRDNIKDKRDYQLMVKMSKQNKK